MCCRHTSLRRQMGFQWGNGAVFFPCSTDGQFKLQSKTSWLCWNDKWAERTAYKWKNKGSSLGSQEVCYSPGSHEETGNSPQGWCNIDACVMAEENAQSHPSFYWHVEELSCICSKFPLPKTRATIPSSTPFSLPALIFVNPSLLILFLLPSIYFHLLPVTHSMGNSPAFHSSVFPNVLPLLPWLFCSHCRFSH